MTDLAILIAVITALTALAVWLDHAGIDVGDLFGTTDPREIGERGRKS